VLPGRGLTFPPVPPPLASRIRPFGEGVFGTWYEAPPLDDLAGHLRAAAAGAEDYVVMGHGGSATPEGPWVLHFHLVWGPLVVLVQCRYGGQRESEAVEADARRVEGELGEVAALVSACGLARIAGYLPDPGRLVVVASDVEDSTWGWGVPGADGRLEHPVAGGRGPGVLAAARSWAESLEEPATL
jgi:hypothetical protein